MCVGVCVRVSWSVGPVRSVLVAWFIVKTERINENINYTRRPDRQKHHLQALDIVGGGGSCSVQGMHACAVGGQAHTWHARRMQQCLEASA